MYEQAVLSVDDPKGYAVVHQAIASAYSPSGVSGFLKSVERAGLRIRHFETVLNAKLLGDSASTEYSRLSHADQGQIRELYLASLEQVPPDLRERFFKLYAYY